jgi:hypothetical protein
MKKLFVFGLLLWACVTPLQAQVTTKLATGALTTVLSTELNNLVNNGFTSASSVFNNAIGQTGNGYPICRVEGFFTFAAQPTANTGVSVWFLKATDATPTFESTPSSTLTLGRPPDVVLPVTTGTSQTVTRVAVDVLCPAYQFKVSAKNDGTNQSMAASGNTIKILMIAPQGS